MARSMGAARFTEQCLALLGELIGALAGKLKVRGDMSTGVKWDAES